MSFTLLAAASAASAAWTAVAVDVTGTLSALLDLNDVTELAGRLSLTLLAVPNGNLPWSPSAFAAESGANLIDVLRDHVLLEYLAPTDLRRLPACGKLVSRDHVVPDHQPHPGRCGSKGIRLYSS